MSFACGETELVRTELRALTEHFHRRAQPHLVCARLSLSVLQLLGVLLPDGEDPVVATEVVAA